MAVPQLIKNAEYILKPLSWLYGLGSGIRNSLFDLGILKSTRFKIPVISVGNLSAGGTGKTPFTEYLITLLNDEFNVAILSRGYKRKSKGFQMVNTDSSPEAVGDEPLQIKKKFKEIIVAVDRNRVHGIRILQSHDPTPDVIILDDAFQHRYVSPGLSILLMDYNHPYYHDHLLPLGRLREHPDAIGRAHMVVVTKCPTRIKAEDRQRISGELQLQKHQDLYFSHIEYGDLQPVFSHDFPKLSMTDLQNNEYQILMVTGIANPDPLRKFLHGFSHQVMELEYPDHHTYDLKDIYMIMENFDRLDHRQKVIITTEKDAIRFQKFLNIAQQTQGAWYYIPIKTGLTKKEEKELNNRIRNYVEQD